MNLTPEGRERLRQMAIQRNKSEKQRKAVGDYRRGKTRKGEITSEGRESISHFISERNRRLSKTGQWIERLRQIVILRNKTTEMRESSRNRAIALNSQGRHETQIEKRVRNILSEIGVEFEREKAFRSIGIVDFYLPNQQLAIECDGGYWHSRPGAKEKDQDKDKRLSNLGIRVLRLTESEIMKSPEQVYSKIMDAINQPAIIRFIRQLRLF